MEVLTRRRFSRPQGMAAFVLVWAGQILSLTGTAMASFALALWAWEVTGLATALALVTFFSFGPTVLLSPIAGALVDRSNRKLMLALTDLGAGVASLAILLLFTTGQLAIWHLYVAAACVGAFGAFQFPALSAAVTTMVPKAQYGRANGMLSLAESAAQVAGPLLAAFLIALLGISGVLVIDVVTFIIALALLVPIVVPQPDRTPTGPAGWGDLWRESLDGFRYILARPGLLAVQIVFLGTNLIGAFFFTLISPLVLARTGGDEATLGLVLGAAGLGGVVGGIVMSLWGGPRRRIWGVLLGMAGAMLFGQIPFGLVQTLPAWLVAAFAANVAIPILNGSNQALWQAKVPPELQGRVFATRRLIAQISLPISLLLVGPLADFVFEPAMQPGGALVAVLGGLFGTGPGAGMAVMMSSAGVLGLAISLGGALVRVVRNVEADLPDHT